MGGFGNNVHVSPFKSGTWAYFWRTSWSPTCETDGILTQNRFIFCYGLWLRSLTFSLNKCHSTVSSQQDYTKMEKNNFNKQTHSDRGQSMWMKEHASADKTDHVQQSPPCERVQSQASQYMIWSHSFIACIGHATVAASTIAPRIAFAMLVGMLKSWKIRSIPIPRV